MAKTWEIVVSCYQYVQKNYFFISLFINFSDILLQIIIALNLHFARVKVE